MCRKLGLSLCSNMEKLKNEKEEKYCRKKK